MTQLSRDCFALGGLQTLDQALSHLDAHIGPVIGMETAPLPDADGRILAEPVVANRASPPWDNSAVDGFAVRHADLSPDQSTDLPVAQRIPAGATPSAPLRPATAARIFTGAPLPENADTVLMQEDCTLQDDRIALPPGIALGIALGANRRRAGEDFAKGDLILAHSS